MLSGINVTGLLMYQVLLLKTVLHKVTLSLTQMVMAGSGILIKTFGLDRHWYYPWTSGEQGDAGNDGDDGDAVPLRQHCYGPAGSEANVVNTGTSSLLSLYLYTW